MKIVELKNNLYQIDEDDYNYLVKTENNLNLFSVKLNNVKYLIKKEDLDKLRYLSPFRSINNKSDKNHLNDFYEYTEKALGFKTNYNELFNFLLINSPLDTEEQKEKYLFEYNNFVDILTSKYSKLLFQDYQQYKRTIRNVPIIFRFFTELANDLTNEDCEKIVKLIKEGNTGGYLPINSKSEKDINGWWGIDYKLSDFFLDEGQLPE